MAPIIAPTRTAETTHPYCQEFNANCFSIKRMAPEIDPVSYPKSNPPKAAKKYIHPDDNLCFMLSLLTYIQTVIKRCKLVVFIS